MYHLLPDNKPFQSSFYHFYPLLSQWPVRPGPCCHDSCPVHPPKTLPPGIHPPLRRPIKRACRCFSSLPVFSLSKARHSAADSQILLPVHSLTSLFFGPKHGRRSQI